METIRAHPEKIQNIRHGKNAGGALRDLLSICENSGIPLREEERKTLEKLSGTSKHQGVVAVLSDFNYSSVDKIVSAWKNSGKRAFILLLDGIQDPHNLGAIIRSAECAGIHGIIIPKHRASEITATVEKVSAGASAVVPIARVTNIARTIDELKSMGMWVAGSDISAETCLYETDFNTDLALVVGSEGKGIRPLVKKKCDFLISIPMFGKINSLNASVSAAIVLYEAVRQRLKY